MKKNIEAANPRVAIYSRLRFQHGIHLTGKQLDEIEEIYYLNHRRNVMNVGLYRLINVIFTVVGILVFLFLKDAQNVKIFFVAFLGSFLIYNLSHFVVSVFQYAKIKEPEPQPTPEENVE